MKKLGRILGIVLLTLSLSGCELSANTFDEAIGEQINEVTEELGDKMDEKISETIDRAKTGAVEKVEDSLSNSFTKIQQDMIERVGVEVDKLVEYKPGLWYEDSEVVTYEIQGMKMNGFWEKDEDAGTLEIQDAKISAEIPEEAILTLSFFENLPEIVSIIEKNNGEEKLVEVSEMRNPLTGKATYSFVVLFEEKENVEYIMKASFGDDKEVSLEILLSNK